MFNLKVVGLDEARHLVAAGWPTRIVSLTGDDEVRHDTHAPHLHIQVNDAGFADDWAIRPAPEHLQTVFAFTEDLTDADRLLVHCFAGLSRSTAVAIGILIQHGMMCQQAFDHVAMIRNTLMPNTLFIRHIDDLFDLQNQLVDHASAYRGHIYSPNPSWR